jgi:integrase/recombinase XerC
MREAKPYYKKSHKAWYYNDNGKPVRLDENKKTAHEIWKKLRACERATDNLVENPTALVANLVAQFLDWAEHNKKPSTYDFYQKHCESFCKRYKLLRIMDLRNLHVTSWIDKCYRDCGPTRRNGAITSLKRALNWCRQEGYIKDNPIAYCKKPRARTRGDAAYITPEQFEAIVKDVQENCKRRSGECFLDLLTVLRETGCRPQEMRQVEARHLTHSPATWTFDLDESKSGEKTGKRRTVYLTKKAYEICRRLALKNPDGPMFRNSDGRPWTVAAINCHFQRIQQRTKIKAFA